jgi:hypothetical protein
VTDTHARPPAGMDHAVLTCVDPLVDLAGVAAMAGACVDEVVRWSADDERFPPPVGELSGGPVFGYGAACDYLDVRAGRGRSDAYDRAQIAEGRDGDTLSVMARMARAGRAPLLAGRSQPPTWWQARPSPAHRCGSSVQGGCAGAVSDAGRRVPQGTLVRPGCGCGH